MQNDMIDKLSKKALSHFNRCAALASRTTGVAASEFVRNKSREWRFVASRYLTAWLAEKTAKANGLIVTPRDVATYLGLTRAQGYYVQRRASEVVMLDQAMRERVAGLLPLLTQTEAAEVKSWLDYSARAAEKLHNMEGRGDGK